MSARPDQWDPEQYLRFSDERTQPFRDLLDLVEPAPGGTVFDLGCGTGALTTAAHRRLGAARTLGIDRSPAMLAQTAPSAGDGVSYVEADMTAFGQPATADVVVSNAALHWVGDHEAVLARWTGLLRPGGQLAVQIPANADHLSHVIAGEVAEEEPFRSALGGNPPPDPVLGVARPEEYATLLHALGFERQHVRLQVYGHLLASSGDVVEWVRGSTLTRFSAQLAPDVFEHYLDRYRERLLVAIGRRAPYFYAFKRILMWGRLAA